MEAGSIFVVTSFYRVRLFLLHCWIGVIVVRSWFLQASERIPEAAWVKNACSNCCKHIGNYVFLVEPTRFTNDTWLMLAYVCLFHVRFWGETDHGSLLEHGALRIQRLAKACSSLEPRPCDFTTWIWRLKPWSLQEPHRMSCQYLWHTSNPKTTWDLGLEDIPVRLKLTLITSNYKRLWTETRGYVPSRVVTYSD